MCSCGLWQDHVGQWLARVGVEFSGAASLGPRAIAALAIVLAYDILFVALLTRVIGSWLGMFRYSKWMRPAYILTDWLVGPISRVLPPMGMLDWSPPQPTLGEIRAQYGKGLSDEELLLRCPKP